MVEGDGRELQVAVGWPEMVLFVVDMMYIWLVKDKEIWAVEQWWSIVTVEWLTVAVEQVAVEQVGVEQVVVEQWSGGYVVCPMVHDIKQIREVLPHRCSSNCRLVIYALFFKVGNRMRAAVEAIGSFNLILPNGLVIVLDNCHYAPSITRGVVSLSRLVDNGYPKETMGYYFYNPHENKNSIARYAEFFENSLTLQEANAEEHELGDLNEPPNYKFAMSDHESDKWVDAMNAEMQSMKDNQVVYLPPDGRTVGPVADISAIRILLAIATFYDYEIWQIDVKTAFLNGHLSKDVDMVQPEGFVDQKHPNKDLGEAPYILGIKITRDRSKWLIALSQSAYFDKILKKFKIENFKRVEYIAAAEASMEAVWIRKFIDGLGNVMPTNKRTMEMLCDNTTAIAITSDPVIMRGPDIIIGNITAFMKSFIMEKLSITKFT
ncbi:retrotransposon protein, putative, ty1-copia subclass [Tanacetum coccineum]